MINSGVSFVFRDIYSLEVTSLVKILHNFNHVQKQMYLISNYDLSIAIMMGTVV